MGLGAVEFKGIDGLFFFCSVMAALWQRYGSVMALRRKVESRPFLVYPEQ